MRRFPEHRILVVDAIDVDVDARLEEAYAAYEAGRYDEAVVAYVWLWEHMLEHDPHMRAVRYSYVVGEIGDLIAAHPPARAVIEALRDRTAPPDSGPLDAEQVVDWSRLNQALGEQARTLAWFDALPARSQLGFQLEHEYIDHLEAVGRWADAGAIYDPKRELDLSAKILELERRSPAVDDDEQREIQVDYHRDKVTRLLRALRAAGRTDEAYVAERRARELGIELDASDGNVA